MTMDAVARAEAFRKKRLVTFEVGDGDSPLFITVAIPGVMDLIDSGMDPILANVNVSDEDKQQAIDRQQKELTDDVRKFFPIAKKICQKAMVSPKLWLEETEPPEGYVTPQMMGNLLLELANEIMELLNKDVGGAGEATANFRVATGGENGNQGGDVVRDEPPGDPPPTDR